MTYSIWYRYNSHGTREARRQSPPLTRLKVVLVRVPVPVAASYRRRELRPGAHGPSSQPERAPEGTRKPDASLLRRHSETESRRPRTSRAHPFYSKRFHVLLNSLFKVLFNFPSRYL